MKALSILLGLACVLSALGAEEPRPLTLKEAREIALRAHPRITVAELRALVARESVRETRSGFLPSLWGSLGAVGAADNNTRIVSGGLPVSSVFDRASASVNLTQLVTDFGRTANLTDSARLKARAEEQNAEATRAQLLLQVDIAYLGGLQAEAGLRVAGETVRTRKSIRDQITALASNKLKSELDASFAEVGLQEAKLLQLKTDNEVQSSFATLGAVLGSREAQVYRLVEEAAPPALTNGAAEFTAIALRDRPDLQRLRLERDSAVKFARAERGLHYPTISIQGTAGVLPYRESGVNHDYAAAGIVLNLPLFNGFLYEARDKEAVLRAQAAEAALIEEENNVIRDTRIAWLNAGSAYERLAVTVTLVEQSRRSYALAEARYKTGSSSIVELNRAQLNLTSAELTDASARYEYLLRRALLDYQIGHSH